ncbi:MAG: hypothetical protein ACJ75H_06355 [Thermoanaerobaculia bacterium]
MPAESGGKVPPALGEALSGVRWDYDPSRRLLSPLVEAARYFEHFPWEGDDEPEGPLDDLDGRPPG